MVNEQPDFELDTGELRDRQRVDPVPDRRPSDCNRFDRVRLAALTRAFAPFGRQLRRHAHDAFPTREQEPLERLRDVAESSSAHTAHRPDTSPTATDPRTSGAWRAPSAPRAPGPSPHSPQPGCARPCASPFRSRSSEPSLQSGSPQAGSLVDTAQSGRCHAPIKSGQRSTGAASDTTRAGQTEGRQQTRESARRRPELPRPSRTAPDQEQSLTEQTGNREDLGGWLHECVDAGEGAFAEGAHCLGNGRGLLGYGVEAAGPLGECPVAIGTARSRIVET